MKIFSLITILFMTTTLANAQSWVGLGVGGNQSSVYYKSSDGLKDKSIKGVPAAYVSVYYQLDLAKNGNGLSSRNLPSNLINTEFGFKRAMARDSDSNTLSKWTMDYFSTYLGYRHVFVSKSQVNPYFGIGMSADILLSGVQQIGFEQYDLKDDLSHLNMGVSAEGGLNYIISQEVLGILNISYNQGLTNLEKNEQKSRLSGIKIGISLMFKLNK
jgi:hypothetical protein